MDVRYDLTPAYLVRTVWAVLLVALGCAPVFGQSDCNPELFPQDTVFLTEGPGPAGYCLAGGVDLNDYVVRVDGLEVSPVADSTCARDTSGFTRPVNFYSTAQLPGNGFSGPFKLETWDVNETTFQDSVYENVRALADGMAAFDPSAGWYYNEQEQGIAANVSDFRYSQLFLTQQAGLQPTFELELEAINVPDTTQTPGGARTAIELRGEGWIDVEVTARDGGCSEKLAIFRFFPRPLTRDTFELRVQGDMPNGPFCVDFSEFEETPTGTSICGSPQNGTLVVASVGCVEYTPDPGYRGRDSACVVVCENGSFRCDTTDLIFTVSDPGDCPEIFGPSRQNVVVDDCETAQRICLPSLPRDPSEYTIFVDSRTESDTISCGITANQVAISLLPGSYQIGAVDASGCSDTVRVVVSCGTNAPGGECSGLSVSEDSELFVNDCGDRGSFLVNSPDSDPRSLKSTINGEQSDGRVVGNQLQWDLDTGNYDVVVADPNRGCSNRFSLSVSCDTCAFIVDLPPTLFDQKVRCGGGLFEICLPASPGDLDGLQLSVDGEAYTGEFTGCDVTESLFMNLTTMPGGGSTGPYFIDSFRINGELFSGQIIGRTEMADSLTEWDSGGTWEWDAAANQLVGGNLEDTYGELSVTQESSGSIARLGVQKRERPRGTLVSIPAGELTRRLTFENGNGCEQSVELMLECSTDLSFEETVREGDSVVFCVNVDSLGEIATMENACEENDAAVTLAFDVVEACVTATGVQVGATEVCIVTCDTDGACDTSNYTVTVLERGTGGLDAINDTLRTSCAKFISQSIVDNDIFDGGLDTIRIVDGPSNGSANTNNDGVLSYDPNVTFCGGLDSLTYEIIQGGVVSRATVLITVSSELLTVYTGFSPNGDGENDQFYIEGIQDLPTAVVRVYNRWGNLVLEQDNYQNDWEGFWDGKRLPDGTYYYVIEIPGEDPVAGFVQLWR